MELKDLKNIWKNQKPADVLDENDIRPILRKKTQNTLQKIQKILQLELGILFVTAVAIAYVLVYTNSFDNLLLRIIFPGVLIFFFVLYVITYRKISKTKITDITIKECLESTITQMEKFLKLYIFSTVILAGLGFFLGIWVTQLMNNELGDISDGSGSDGLWGFLLLAFGFALLLFPFVRWYINKLYRKPLELLKAYHNELENQ